jgi:putative flippase GtrA
MTIGAQFFRFLLVGGFATGLQYLILIILVQTNWASVVAASSIGFATSAIFNYALNRSLTFRSSRAHAQALPRFLIVATTGLLLNGGMLWILHEEAGLYYLWAQILVTGGTLVWNFALNRTWTFSSAEP